MKTLEAKPFDQNDEYWKQENRLFTSTVLADRAKSNRYARTQRSSSSLIRFRCSNSYFLLETGIAGHERLFLAKWHSKAEKELRRRPFFDITDRHEKLYGRSRLYSSAEGRQETGSVLSLFSSLSFDVSMKNSMQRWSSDFQGLFRVKIRKMVLGSNDHAPLKKKKKKNAPIITLTLKRTGSKTCCLNLSRFSLSHLTALYVSRWCCLSKSSRWFLMSSNCWISRSHPERRESSQGNFVRFCKSGNL